MNIKGILIERSKTKLARCKACKGKIYKGEYAVRIEKGIGKQKRYLNYHLDCLINILVDFREKEVRE